MCENLISYVKRNRWPFLFIIGIIIISQGGILLSDSVGIDTEITINDARETNWLSIGRYGLIFFEKVLDLYDYNPIFSCYLAIPLFALGCILISYVFYCASNKDDGFSIIIIGSLLMISPIMSEQIYFKNQVLEISICYCLSAISVLYSFLFVEKKKYVYFVISIVLNVITFGTYQAFVPMYIVLIETIFVLFCISSKKDVDFIYFIKYVTKTVSIFLSSFVVSELISKYFESSNYLNEQIEWFVKPFGKIFNNIFVHLYSIVFGTNIFFSKFYLFFVFLSFVVLMIMVCRNNFIKCKVVVILVYILILLSPFYMTLLLGNMPAIRSQLVYPLSFSIYAYIIYYCAKEKNKKKILILFYVLFSICCYSVMKSALKLNYTDKIRYESDVRMATNIINDINKLDLDIDGELIKIAIVGNRQPDLNNSVEEGEIIGYSFFEWDSVSNTTPGILTTRRCCDFFKTLGVFFEPANEEEMVIANKYAETMDSYPNVDYIKTYEGLVIIKLDDYDK